MSVAVTGPLFIADHAALDFLNSVAQVNGEAYDYWQSDDDVKSWLQHAGLAGDEIADFAAGALLQEARQLRETIRELVQQKKAGVAIAPAELNRYLAAASSYQQLEEGADGSLQIKRVYGRATPAQLLAPVAELAAALLADEHFALTRKCEHPECTLWFYDRTKAHRRRWCSMALCGNRAKVARFRQQQKEV